MTTDEDKQLRLQVLQKNEENAALEVELITDQIKLKEPQRDLLERFIAVRKVMHELALKNYSYVMPTYAFQKDAEYVAAQKELAQLEFELDMIKKQNDLDVIDGQLKSFKEQLESHQKAAEEIARLKKEMGE